MKDWSNNHANTLNLFTFVQQHIYSRVGVPWSWLDLVDSGSDGQCVPASWTGSPCAAFRTFSASEEVDILLYIELECYSTKQTQIHFRVYASSTGYFPLFIFSSLTGIMKYLKLGHLAIEGGHGLAAVCDSIDLWIYWSKAGWRRRCILCVSLEQDVGQCGLSGWMDHQGWWKSWRFWYKNRV